ncbi:MAG: hypothetical protein DMF06_11645 [Verrucomicrobia bacterium]|nr:MAG: hypothetical protein DMF06_11645 [Verrucomicrobiota bacterium]
MEDIIGGGILLGVFFGLEVVGLVVLILAAVFARQRAVIVVCGIAAAVVMAVEYCVLYICAAGKYADGWGGETLPVIIAAISIVSLGIYFPVAIIRSKRKQLIAAPVPS